MSKGPLPAAALIIPTRNSAALLARCLPSFANQRLPDPYEVIVVDNGSDDGTHETVLAAMGKWPHLRLVHEAVRGAGHARHAGAMNARAPILVFVDGDMVADPELVAHHVKAHGQKARGCVIGRIVSAPSRHPFERMMAYIYDGPRASLGSREPTYDDCWPGNLSLPREVYLRLGGFQDLYGGFGGEGANLAQRMADARIPLRYAPQAVAEHHFRDRFGPRLRRSYWNGVTLGYHHARGQDVALRGFRPVGRLLWPGLVQWLSWTAAVLLEPFDRGSGPPGKPLAFLYDLGLRLATGRGLHDFEQGRVTLPGLGPLPRKQERNP
jgi:glycosyltransferase involved in cell wall biosynthesis